MCDCNQIELCLKYLAVLALSKDFERVSWKRMSLNYKIFLFDVLTGKRAKTTVKIQKRETCFLILSNIYISTYIFQYTSGKEIFANFASEFTLSQ